MIWNEDYDGRTHKVWTGRCTTYVPADGSIHS
jgi:hypothetical protein